MAPSVTSPVAPRYLRRVARMSPVTRAPTSPRASMTSTSPGLIVSKARRCSEAAPACVAATSWRVGRARAVKARPTRLCSGVRGATPDRNAFPTPRRLRIWLMVGMLTDFSFASTSSETATRSIPRRL